MRDTKKISCISGDVRLLNIIIPHYTSIPRNILKDISSYQAQVVYTNLLLVHLTIKHSFRWPLIVFIAYKHYNFKSDSFAGSDCSNEGCMYKHLFAETLYVRNKLKCKYLERKNHIIIRYAP